MKKPAVLIFAALLFGCDPDHNHQERFDVGLQSDDYRLIRISRFGSNSNNPGGGIEFEYDDDGNLVKESMMDGPNVLTSYKKYEYDGDRLVRKSVYEGEVGNLLPGTRTEYFYTGDKLTEQRLIRSDETLFYSEHFEYSNDKLVNWYKENEELGIHHQIRYTYNGSNQLVKEESYMYDQELEEFSTYFYDGSNRLLKTEKFDRNGALVTEIQSIYKGGNKNVIAEIEVHHSGRDHINRGFVYDRWGNLIEINSGVPGASMCRLFKRTYNGELLLEEATIFPGLDCAPNSTLRYVYEEK